MSGNTIDKGLKIAIWVCVLATVIFLALAIIGDLTHTAW